MPKIKNLKIFDLLIFFSLIIYSVIINYYFGNRGVMPVDSFMHFDSAYLFKKNVYPIRDYWLPSGLLITYIQAFFFFLFGETWQTYVFHASVFNTILCISFYYFFRLLQLNKFYSVAYSLCIASLGYSTAGVPLIYIHSLIFSLLVCISLGLIYIYKNKSAIFFLPILMCLSFLSCQAPSAYINLLAIFSVFFFLYTKKNFLYLIIFILGCILSVTCFVLFLILTETSLKDFFYQYLLFPLSINSSRLTSDINLVSASVSHITLDKIIFDFKFFYVFLIPLIFFSIIKKISNINFDTMYSFNLIFILTVVILILNQLITQNQIYIYVLIPIIAAMLHINLKRFDIKKKYFLVIIICTILITFKYHYRNNVEKRFLDFQWTNINESVSADLLHPKLNNLKWITPKGWGINNNPSIEIETLKYISGILEKDNRNIAIVTNYQLFSLILDKKILHLNMNYSFTTGSSSHPNPGSKYYAYYKKFIKDQLAKHEIEVIYNIELGKDNFFRVVDKKCLKNELSLHSHLTSYEIIDCSK